MDIPKLIAAQRAYFETGATHDIAVRRRALQALQASVRRHEEVLCSALRADLGKSAVESYMTEIGIVAGEIRFALRNLKRWMRPRRVPTPLFAWPARSRVRYEPLGVVLVVAPWNYPLQLTLLPLVGALAAGNCVVLKPSPGAPATAAVLSEIVGECFPEELVALVPHAPQAVEELLTQRFDHIFYTGGGTFGREIMVRAAERLTPVTLELGGKSPCVVGAAHRVGEDPQCRSDLRGPRFPAGARIGLRPAAGGVAAGRRAAMGERSALCGRLSPNGRRRPCASCGGVALHGGRRDGLRRRGARRGALCRTDDRSESRPAEPSYARRDFCAGAARADLRGVVGGGRCAARRRPAAGTLLFRRRTRRPPSVRAGAVGRGGVQRCGDAGVESAGSVRAEWDAITARRRSSASPTAAPIFWGRNASTCRCVMRLIPSGCSAGCGG